jgi:hypothetical protein
MAFEQGQIVDRVEESHCDGLMTELFLRRVVVSTHICTCSARITLITSMSRHAGFARKNECYKDIVRENKKSTTPFLLKYYHNLNLFTRDDDLTQYRETVKNLSTVSLLAVHTTEYKKEGVVSFHAISKTSFLYLLYSPYLPKSTPASIAM